MVAKTETFFDAEAVLEEHGDYLFRFAMLRVRDADVAEEVVQDTLLAALEAKSQFRGQASVRTWLVGILKHKILDHFRARHRAFSLSDLDPPERTEENLFDQKGNWRVEPGDWTLDPGAMLEREEFWQTFDTCMSELPERSAQIFALREFDGLSSKEIGDHLSISPAHLDVLMYRARLSLAHCLDIRWFHREHGRARR